ncbi:hypothetical protein LIA77_01470 [Sarocladium implicatum]|nr:hypothetical protein LIA77_01470 [Sarocladium implicatum]
MSRGRGRPAHIQTSRGPGHGELQLGLGQEHDFPGVLEKAKEAVVETWSMLAAPFLWLTRWSDRRYSAAAEEHSVSEGANPLWQFCSRLGLKLLHVPAGESRVPLSSPLDICLWSLPCAKSSRMTGLVR